MASDTGNRRIGSTATALVTDDYNTRRVILWNLGPTPVDVSDDPGLEWGTGLRIPPCAVRELVVDGTLYAVAPAECPDTARPEIQYRAEAL